MEGAPCAAQSGEVLEFVYIDAGAGGAAGGHTAVRLGETVFHYEYRTGDLLLLARDPWDDFLYEYNDLQNRSLTLARVPVTRSGYDTIRAHLFERYVEQERRLLRVDRLSDQLELLRRFARGEDELFLEGLGLFSPTRAGSAAAVDLRRRVESDLEEGWWSNALRDLDEQLGRLRLPDPTAGEQAELWSVRLRELLSLRSALRLLRDARDLEEDVLLRAVENGGPLTAREQAVGELFRLQVAASVLTLLTSDRPDRGSALLVQMARYQAVCLSLESGELVTLDPFSARAEPADDRSGEPFQRDARADLASLRAAFVDSGDHRATAYGQIEAAQGRLAELERGQRTGRPGRVERGPLFPSRGRAVRAAPGVGREAFLQAARVTEQALERAREELAITDRYNLITRNCVTEIVRDVNQSFASAEEAQAQMGGVMEPGEWFSFIPFRLPPVVVATYPSAATELLPSYRLRRLDRLYQQIGPVVWLRENNTVTSTLYPGEWAEQDSVFLFFTDDLVLPRPLFGAVNLLYATAHAAGGLLRSPFDQGDLLNRSLRGMLFSLPEIAFFNIRKGMYRSLPADDP